MPEKWHKLLPDVINMWDKCGFSGRGMVLYLGGCFSTLPVFSDRNYRLYIRVGRYEDIHSLHAS